jgi:hypothetical protein
MMARKKWELKMHEARELRKQGAGLLYDRVTLLVDCYDDPAFREWHEQAGTNELDFLDDELSDTACSFMTLRAVLVAFPARDEWITHNIRELIALTIDSERASRQGEGKRMSWKERALAAEAECERLRSELQTYRNSLEIVASAKCG